MEYKQIHEYRIEKHITRYCGIVAYAIRKVKANQMCHLVQFKCEKYDTKFTTP